MDTNVICVRYHGLLINIESLMLTDTTPLIELLNETFGIKTLKEIKLLYNSKQDGEN